MVNQKIPSGYIPHIHFAPSHPLLLINSPNVYHSHTLSCTHLVTSGSHWAVREGHSKAWVITRSYRKGVFFFHILYSSLMTLSSTASSKVSVTHRQSKHKLFREWHICNKIQKYISFIIKLHRNNQTT